MSETALRADARRNREGIMTAAGELFARLGHEAQMEQIAAHVGQGMEPSTGTSRTSGRC